MKNKLSSFFSVIGVVAVCVFVLCAALFFIVPSEVPEDTPTATLTNAKSTRTPLPTGTPRPTKTRESLFTATITLTPTITPTSTATDTPTETAPPTETADVRALYSKIQNRELSTYPDNHEGERVKVRGMVFNVNSDTELQVFLGNSSDYPAYIVFSEPFQEVYEDEYITVYGVVGGEICGTNAFGGEVCQPLIEADFYEKQ